MIIDIGGVLMSMLKELFNKLLGNKEFLVQDPDGYLLRFSEDLGEKEMI